MKTKITTMNGNARNRIKGSRVTVAADTGDRAVLVDQFIVPTRRGLEYCMKHINGKYGQRLILARRAVELLSLAYEPKGSEDHPPLRVGRLTFADDSLAVKMALRLAEREDDLEFDTFALYYAAKDADQLWHEELAREYGEANAGDVRYDNSRNGATERLAALRDLARKTSAAWREQSRQLSRGGGA